MKYDVDKMSEEEFENVLQGIMSGSITGAEDSGSKDEDDTSSAGSEENNSDDNGMSAYANLIDGEIEEDDINGENKEDTEGSKESENDTETNEQDDGSEQDTGADAEDEGSENTPVGQDTDGKDKESEDSASEGDGSAAQTNQIDATDYEKYKKFYEEIANAEFVANGKKVKGFTDPAKIIQSQQMAYGFSEKMASFKQYRPFMQALKDNGMLEDTAKFNFAMDLLKGDKEALKQHLKSLEVDPLDLDMDQISYVGKNHTTSSEALVLEDTLEQARNYGVEDKLRNVIGKEWDNESFNEFLTIPEVRNDLLNHMVNGQFDLVQSRIAEMKVLDTSGRFSEMKSTDQYREAVKSLTAEAKRIEIEQQRIAMLEASNKPSAGAVDNSAIVSPTKSNVKEADLAAAEAAKKAAAAKEEAEYKRKLEEKKRADEARRAAASVSGKKSGASKKETFDPMALEGEELDAFVNSLIRSR